LLAAAVCYYPTQIAGSIEEQPRCPVLMHFGESDPIATTEHARLLRAAHDQRVDIQLYSAGHGFNCDDIPGFHAPSAALALRRTLDFLNAHMA
jgi:carboxymethylenebutenolidase